nr:matrix protein [Chandipura virus]
MKKINRNPRFSVTCVLTRKMQRIKKFIARKEKGEKGKMRWNNTMDYDSPPSYQDARRGIFPSAPLFGMDDDMMEYIPSLGIQTLKIQYKCVVNINAINPFRDFREAISAMQFWEADYGGYIGKKPFYRAIVLHTARQLKTSNPGILDRGVVEYHATTQGRALVFHSLGPIPSMMFVPETFTREWNILTNKGTINVKIWLGETDTLSELEPILNPIHYRDDREMIEGAAIMGLEIKKQKDNTWLISKSH